MDRMRRIPGRAPSGGGDRIRDAHGLCDRGREAPRRDRQERHALLPPAARDRAERLLGPPRHRAASGDRPPNLRQIGPGGRIAGHDHERRLAARARARGGVRPDCGGARPDRGPEEPRHAPVLCLPDRSRERRGRERRGRRLGGVARRPRTGPLVAGLRGAAHDRSVHVHGLDAALGGARETALDRLGQAGGLRVDVRPPPEAAVARIHGDHAAGAENEPDERHGGVGRRSGARRLAGARGGMAAGSLLALAAADAGAHPGM
jgi:hypothetical protein